MKDEYRMMNTTYCVLKTENRKLFMTKFGNLQSAICNLQFAILPLVIFSASSVFAHQMDVFAKVEGKTIQGKANYHDGTPVKNGMVKAFDPFGTVIGETMTDNVGKFSLEAQFHCNYRLLVDAGDGHGAEYTIPAVMLPADLPQLDPSNASTDLAHSHDDSMVSHSHEHVEDVSMADTQHDHALIEDIHADVDLLQERLVEYEQRIRFRDILGGIGFIVGLVGV